MSKKRILIVEDELAIQMALEDDFLVEGYEVDKTADGLEGYRKAKEHDYDMILLDIMLPEMDGFEVCKKLRYEGIHTPIIMLTAKGQEIDRVLGLEMGADDYVTKPFSPRELQARVKAVLRRTVHKEEDSRDHLFSFRDLQVDFLKYECFKDNEAISLTIHEFDLLKYLIKNRGRVVDRNELLDEVWGEDVVVGPRTIDTHMANLRKKIEDDPARPHLIISVRGVGYKMGT